MISATAIRLPMVTALSLMILVNSALSGVLATSTSSTNTPPAIADKIFVNGRIYSANKQQATFEAMAIRGDTILAMGDNSSVQELSGPNTQIINLKEQFVLPGLHDTHLHPISAMPVEACDLKNEPTKLPAITRHIEDCISRLNMANNEWIVVNTWNFAAGNQPGEGLQTIREALDAASIEKPIILVGSDGHHYGVNSMALARAKNAAGEKIGLTAQTLAHDFLEIAGYVGVDKNGEPNGRLTEDYPLVAIDAGNYFDFGIEARRAAPELLMDVTLPRGITSFLDAAAYPPTLDIYDSLIAKNSFHARASLALYFDPQLYKNSSGEVDYPQMMEEAKALREKYSNVPNVQATFLKLLADGVLEGDPLATPPTLPNAAFSRPYLQPIFNFDQERGLVDVVGYVDLQSPACKDVQSTYASGKTVNIKNFTDTNGFDPRQCLTNAGVLQHEQHIIENYIHRGDAEGFTMFVHAIGDRTVNIALNAIEAAKIDNNSATKHIITHLHMVQPSDFERFKKLDVYSSFTFAWAYTDLEYDLTIIPFIDRIEQMADLYNPTGYYFTNAYPARSILDAGGVILSGSDAPVDTADPRPFVNIEAAVNRTLDGGQLNANQTLTIHEAIASYTINAAEALNQSDIAGSLEVGKKADFIILDQDIIALAEQGRSSQISDTKVLQTWFAGNLVYHRP